MSADLLKRPQACFFLWQNANREKIQKLAGSKDFASVAAKCSELWKAASNAEKAPFEAESKKQKEAYDKYVATPEGQKALLAKKSEMKEGKQAKQDKDAEKAKKKEEKATAREMRDCKSAVKAIEKDDKLKKPLSSYFMWLNDNRARITAMCGGKGGPEVAKKGSELWKNLTEKDKKPYEDRVKKEKEAYNAYIASPAGAAALKAYKEATSAASFKEKVVDEAEEAEAETEASPAKASQKRKADVVSSAPNANAKKTKVAKAGA